MHLELPKVRLESLKDFAKHYLMIVLSILTALGLEQWIESVHHQHAASTASARMDSELLADLGETRVAITQNARTLAIINQLDATVTADLKAGLPTTTINQHIQAHKDQYRLNLNWPGLSTDAWDVAVANQSAGWIDARALQRYSSAYAMLRQTKGWIEHDGVLLFNGPAVLDLQTDLQLGYSVDPRKFLYAVHQMKATIHSTQDELQALAKQLAQTLPAASTGGGGAEPAVDSTGH